MEKNIYRGRKVFITGITGFKGSWLAAWLRRLGADVSGYALPPPTSPSHFALLALDVDFTEGDIRDADKLAQTMERVQPEIVFHLAAQPLVRLSYQDPVNTFSTNVMGCINVFEACRKSSSVRAIVNVTSDKCYENREWVWGYRESDPMGGYDPYSASKGCAELVTASYRNSFFNPAEYGTTHNVLLASARAGNVIGGGDWAADRLVPDIMKAVGESREVVIRNPASIRPWQHVLEPLSGYLLLGAKLLQGRPEFAAAWNFGPADDSAVTVEELVVQIRKSWCNTEYRIEGERNAPHEAGWLKLDCSKARALLHWQPVWNLEQTIAATVNWYHNYYENGMVATLDNLAAYEKKMNMKFM